MKQPSKIKIIQVSFSLIAIGNPQPGPAAALQVQGTKLHRIFVVVMRGSAERRADQTIGRARHLRAQINATRIGVIIYKLIFVEGTCNE